MLGCGSHSAAGAYTNLVKLQMQQQETEAEVQEVMESGGKPVTLERVQSRWVWVVCCGVPCCAWPRWELGGKPVTLERVQSRRVWLCCLGPCVLCCAVLCCAWWVKRGKPVALERVLVGGTPTCMPRQGRLGCTAAVRRALLSCAVLTACFCGGTPRLHQLSST
jgi:hypothetical protein